MYISLMSVVENFKYLYCWEKIETGEWSRAGLNKCNNVKNGTTFIRAFNLITPLNQIDEGN